MKKIYLFVAFWTGLLSGCADNRFGYLHMDPEPAKLQMDVTLNRLQGLLQQDRAVDEGVSYQLRFLYAYGRTVEIRVQAPETWGVRFANGTYTLPQGSGIAFNEEAAPQTLSIPVVAGEDSKPLLAGSMPVSITVLDPQGEVLLSEQSTIQVFFRDEVFTTVGELNERWRLSLGDALIYDPQHPNDNQGNRAVVYASLDASKDVEVVEDFGGTGLKGIRIRRGQTLSTALLAWREYVIATDDCTGFFYWSPDWAIADGESPAYDPSGGVPGRIYDFETGEVEDSAVGSVCVSGSNAKDVNNRTSNYNSPTNIIAGVGDERIVNLVPSTTTWYYKGEGRSVLNETGRYLVQWNLLDRKPDVNGGDTGLKVVGKLRLLVEVVDRFESDPETVTVGTFNEAWRLAVGDALLYDSEIPATSENKLVIQACLEKPEAGRLENIDNYGDLSEAYSFPAVKVRVGTPIGYQSGTTAFKLNLTTAVALDNILKTANNKGVTQSTGDDRLLNKAVSNNNLWLIGAESVFNRAGVYVCQWDLIDKNVTPSVVTGKLRIVVVAVEDGEF
ncbi:hypothetical protein [uncultured Alistipes sp.]|uniref:hypothetical protein n=1 Tax=uncultured Alistipes sp. TaxID=538949 RepID=UPI0026163071|nr:hypothetical protein [uncultured Alistipes sp.]